MNIALLGGRFDPPHLAHYWIAESILEQKKNLPGGNAGIDQVWLVPDFQNAFRPIVASATNRLAMLRWFETDTIKISSCSIEHKTLYTIQTVEALQKMYKHTFSWVIGADLISEVASWHESQRLQTRIPFLVYPRQGFNVGALPTGFALVEEGDVISNISSSRIRDRIKKGLPVKGLVFPEVEKYIVKHRLYQ